MRHILLYRYYTYLFGPYTQDIHTFVDARFHPVIGTLYHTDENLKHVMRTTSNLSTVQPPEPEPRNFSKLLDANCGLYQWGETGAFDIFTDRSDQSEENLWMRAANKYAQVAAALVEMADADESVLFEVNGECTRIHVHICRVSMDK